MKNYQQKPQWRKGSRSVLSRSVAMAVAGLAASSMQTVYAQDDADPMMVEEVVVTGSRIIRRELDTPAPISVVGAEAIAESGETDIAKLLREVPALNGSLTATNSTNLTGDQESADLVNAAGVGRLNLRNLGTNRTLVLVNGRRHVSAIQGSADVDTGTIPIALIERVETLTGGSSAIYGADAVSGVVNFVLKEDFEGVDYRLQYAAPEEGGAENVFAAITAGTNFADGRGNVTFSFEYFNQEILRARDRDFADNEGFFELLSNSQALSDAFGRNPDAANVFVPDFRINFSSSRGIIALREAGSGGSVFGGLIDGDNDFGVIPGVPALQVFDGNGVREFNRGIESNPFEASGGDGIETINPFEAIAPDIERYNINVLSHFEIVDGWEAYGELKYVQSDVIDSAGINFNDDIPIALDNAFIPADLQGQIDAAIAQGITPQITMSRDILDEAVRGDVDTSRTTFRLVGGIRKDFDNGMRFDMSYNYGRTDIDTTNLNSRVEDRFFAGVDAVVDPATGNIVCRSDIDPSVIPPSSPFPSSREGFLTFEPGDGQCRPINLFGTDSITADARGWAWIPTQETSQIEQTQFLASLAGNTEALFSLPGGPAQWAIGYEYREETSDFSPPELERAGLLYNTANEARGIVMGEYDVSEVFAEVSLPILADLPLIQTLTVDASFRYTDHSTAGDIDTYGVGAMWQPIDSVRVRGSYNRAVRAPNIFELFSPPQPAFLGVTADPCNPQNIDAGTGFRRQNCALFVAPDFDAADFLSARTAGTTGGNENLAPEEADTYTFGVIWQPEFLDGLAITIDYYDITIDQAIDSLAGVDIANLCVDLPSINNVYCDAIVRDPNRGNAIVDFTSGNVNLGSFETDGIDIGVTYDHQIGESSLRHGVMINYVLNNSEFPDPLDPGFELPDLEQLGIPETIINYNLNWDWQRWGLAYQLRWQSSQFNSGITPEDVAGNPLFADPLKTGDAFVHDVSFRFDLADGIMLSGGINNLTDEEPFLGTYIRPVDTLGRTFFFGVQGMF